MKKQHAFTLIELLVVIAIIAILAAILFPVFAQAKAAAKASQTISNMKQIGTSLQLYISDYDDRFMPRRTVQRNTGGTIIGFLSWKQLDQPYMKNTQLFTDSMNTASKYPDDSSDAAFRALSGQQILGPKTSRGYAFYDIGWFVNQSWNLSDDLIQTYTGTQLEQPANTMAVIETKEIWVDIGPYIGWAKNAPDPDGVVRMSGWNYGGSKWEDKAMVSVFGDTHSKRVAMRATCGKNDELNMWGYVRNNLPTMSLGNLSWYDTFCQTMPAGF
ncbi:MAG: prepilin-type N-terminal cleavage/methylation domain-containing protein [Fimbriimonadaceae bacterium]